MGIYVKIVAMTLVAILVIRDHQHLKFACWGLALAQALNAFNINQIYFSQGHLNVMTLMWNFLDNNTYSISTLPIFALTLSLMLCVDRVALRLLAGGIVALQLHQLMLLESRGTMLGAVCIIVLSVCFMPRRRSNFLLVAIAFAVGTIMAGPPVVKEFASIFGTEAELDDSASSRFLLWRAGVAIIQDYPILGAGPWAGEVLVPQYYDGDLGDRTTKALHNLFFEMATGAGLPAAIALICFYYFVWSSAFRCRSVLLDRADALVNPEYVRSVVLALICGIPGFWVASMFSSGLLIESPYIVVAIGLGAIALAKEYIEVKVKQGVDMNATLISQPANKE
ncbi:O-antigen ligase family protein [Rhodopirellula sp. SWK7]|uniref:O-antigen ligase family protein n=1 Tax=Rhodopirellula sp. SWK7 TaxID=595460 RepID=UPI001360B076|nr:O-antigen ligase family protein [Rhodopirellula sp. SWK7]